MFLGLLYPKTAHIWSKLRKMTEKSKLKNIINHKTDCGNCNKIYFIIIMYKSKKINH